MEVSAIWEKNRELQAPIRTRGQEARGESTGLCQVLKDARWVRGTGSELILGREAGAKSGTILELHSRTRGRHHKILTVGTHVRFAFEKIILAAFKGNRLGRVRMDPGIRVKGYFSHPGET